ncbi:uncharacterized protein BDW47DRAFT_5223 [Aspergillus candidus]|uniref:Uncharacterized protein n=1 Tax=Aspergillus candidus TaxID=41067 RepID=A0A2I2FHF9_ASPCN|nr:hypothetical protein BDW47DRAFT_5223 [Aspergillus candidus]PLB40040.1 hypothetical protein BDW47DRAFT_5223 [Aspergillus candidus]
MALVFETVTMTNYAGNLPFYFFLHFVPSDCIIFLFFLFTWFDSPKPWGDTDLYGNCGDCRSLSIWILSVGSLVYSGVYGVLSG